jgi:hypothetical protein
MAAVSMSGTWPQGKAVVQASTVSTTVRVGFSVSAEAVQEPAARFFASPAGLGADPAVFVHLGV